MSEWLPTSCVLCAQNCGLLVQVEHNRIVKVKGDLDNPRSIGYRCRKGQNIENFQQHEGRLTKPLKKTADGFVEISWEKALAEIGEKLRSIVDKHGPRSYNGSFFLAAEKPEVCPVAAAYRYRDAKEKHQIGQSRYAEVYFSGITCSVQKRRIPNRTSCAFRVRSVNKSEKDV